MINKIYHVSLCDINEIKKELIKDTNIFIGEIEGNNIQFLSDYFDAINKIFKIPRPITLNGAYYDWMTDLDWLDKDSYIIIIYNYDNFFKFDQKAKKIIMNLFKDYILPFWEEEVVKVVVEGEVKSFNIYLVD